MKDWQENLLTNEHMSPLQDALNILTNVINRISKNIEKDRDAEKEDAESEEEVIEHVKMNIINNVFINLVAHNNLCGECTISRLERLLDFSIEQGVVATHTEEEEEEDSSESIVSASFTPPTKGTLH